MAEYSGAFVAFDVAKAKHAIAVAEAGRTGEVRFLGEVGNTPAKIERTIRKLASRYGRLQVCFEAGPTGYGLYRQVEELGQDCLVVAPALIPRRPGERVKTNRRDAVTLARLHRAGELTGVWVPDPVHEAIRDLVRAREAAMDDLRRKRQQLLSFLLRHSRIYDGGGHWTLAHRDCALATAGSVRRARSSRWWWPRSHARWRRFSGQSAARSRLCRTPPLPLPSLLHKAGGGTTEGNSRR
jgi:transposase